MTEGAQKRMGFSAIGGREAKAEKILAILAAADSPLKPADRVLDLGCGSGEIAAQLATIAQVSCADAIDQRTQGKELPFHLVRDTLPFADGAFDIVVSNHVIEHLPELAIHLREVRRVLRPGGIAYLATPNRWWPWEFHARLPLLHFLPAELFSRLAMRWGRLTEPVHLLSLGQLKGLAGSLFDIDVWHPRLLHASAGLQPTLILLLRAR